MYQLSRSKRDVQNAFFNQKENIINTEPTIPSWIFPFQTPSVAKEPIPEEPIQKQEPIPEEPVVEEPVVEEPIQEETVVEEPVVEEPVVEEPIQEETVVEEPVVEEPVVEEPLVEEPIVEEPVVEEPVVEEPIQEEPIVEEPVVEEPVVEEPVVEEPVVEEPIQEEPVVEEPVVEEEPIVEEPVGEEPVGEEPVGEEPVVEDLHTTDHATTYNYKGETYFVDNLSVLQRHYNFPPGNYKSHLCIYKCIRQGVLPYLLYLTVYDKSSKTLVFPSIDETFEITEENDPEEYVQTAIKEKLFDIFPPAILPTQQQQQENEGDQDIFDEQLINGFFLTEENIWITYDATRVAVPTSTDREYFWVSPFEILLLYKYRNIVIDPILTSFFKTVKESSNDVSFYTLKHISDTGTPEFVPTPYILFPCSPAPAGFFGLSTTLFQNIIQEEGDKINLLIPSVSHPQFGNFPLFSSKPIDPYVPKIKRYAVFVDADGEKPTFFFSEDENTKKSFDQLYAEDQTHKYTSISFLYEKTQYWCVKSPLCFTEIYDDTTFLPSPNEEDVPIKTLAEIMPYKPPAEPVTPALIVPPSNADGESNEDEPINEDISVDTDGESNEEEQGNDADSNE
jgi:hypothetical protein